VEGKDHLYSFAEVMEETGLSRAALVVACHRIGKNVFSGDPSEATFTYEEFVLLSRGQTSGRPENVVQKTKRSAKKGATHKKQSSHDVSEMQWNAIENKSPIAISEYMGMSLARVLDVCRELGYEVVDPGDALSKKKAESVRNRLAVGVLSDRETPESNPGLGIDIARLLEDVRTTPTREPRNRVTAAATVRRIELFAREIDVPIEDVTFVMDALHVPRLPGEKEKIARRHESDVMTALGMVEDLPRDRWDRAEVRLRAIAESRGLCPDVLKEFCRQKGILLKHGKHVSTSDALRLVWWLTDPSILERLRRISFPQNESVRVPSDEEGLDSAIDYRGVDLSRQNFSGYVFDGATMASVDLAYCQLVETSFEKANLDGANLSRAVCHGARFVAASCNGTSFRRAVLDGVDFTGASLRGADLVGCSLVGAIFDDADLTDAQIPEGLNVPPGRMDIGLA
jgi:hypothetical protein